MGRTERHRIGTDLRTLQVRTEKIRGLRDESDEFIRLPDAMAGFVRQGLERQSDAAELDKAAVDRAIIREV